MLNTIPKDRLDELRSSCRYWLPDKQHCTIELCSCSIEAAQLTKSLQPEEKAYPSLDKRYRTFLELRDKCAAWDDSNGFCLDTTSNRSCECYNKAYGGKLSEPQPPIYASGEPEELLDLRRKCVHMEAGTSNQRLTTPCETIQADGMRHCQCLLQGAVSINDIRTTFGSGPPLTRIVGSSLRSEPITTHVQGLNPKDAIGVTKAPLSLLPGISDLVTSLVFQTGAVKYGPFNWRETPIQSHIYLEAGRGHIQSVLDGEDFDPESGIHHLAHARACIDIYLDSLATDNLVITHPTKREGMKGGPVFSRSLEHLHTKGLIGSLDKVKEWLQKPWRAEAIGKPPTSPTPVPEPALSTSDGPKEDWSWAADIWVGETIRGNVRFKECPKGEAYRFDIPTRFGGSWTFSFALKSATEIDHTRLDISPNTPNLEHILTYIQNKVWD